MVSKSTESSPRLTLGRWSPITDQILLLRGDAKDLSERFVRDHLRPDYPGARLVTEMRQGSLGELLQNLLPLWYPLPNHWLFIPARDGWTAIFHNCPNVGSGVAVGGLSNLRSAGSVEVAAVMGAAGYILDLERAVGGRSRRLRSFHDGDAYRLFQDGEPFPFEDTAAYGRRRGRERLTSAMIARYVHELGFDWIWDEASYAPDGYGYLVSSDFTNSNFSSLDFDDVHKEWELFLASGEGLR